MKPVFTILGIHIQIVTDDRELDGRIQDICMEAVDPLPVSKDLTVEILKKGEVYNVVEEGETLVSSPDAEWVILYVRELINYRVLEHWRGFVKIHAASGFFRGRRILLVGDKGSGKTTLITRLLFEGANVYGDKTVLVWQGEVMPFPRKFHLKEGTVSLIPQIGPIWKN